MATITPTQTPSEDVRLFSVKWTGFAASGDVGTAVALPAFPDRTVQILGTFAGSIAVELQGSLDGGTTWSPLTDPQGNAISKTAAAIEAITELVPLVRPKATAGSGGAAVDVYLFMGGNRQ